MPRNVGPTLHVRVHKQLVVDRQYLLEYSSINECIIDSLHCP